MKSNELLREVFKKHGAKQIAAGLGLAVSFIYKWCQPDGGRRSGGMNPLERVAALMRLTGDVRPLQWLCEQADGCFVPNARPKALPAELARALSEVVRENGDLLAVMGGAARDGGISAQEAEVIRSRWEQVKSVTEGFVQACERGIYRNGAMLWAFGWWLATGDLPKLAMVEV